MTWSVGPSAAAGSHSMRVRIGLKIFSIAMGLLILMGAASLLSLRMTRTVDDQLKIIGGNYYPGYVSLSHANILSDEESAFVRRLVIALDERPRDDAVITDLRARIAATAEESDAELAEARRHINE